MAAACLVVGIDAPRAQAPVPAKPASFVVIVVDGLRPDYVTADGMPRLFRLGQRGIVFTAHHAVYPTVTRVNASSLVTGAYPEAHGLLGNTIYVPSVNATRGLDTGQRENLEAVERTEGQLLTTPTLGEILRSSGKTLLATSSGSSGSALLLNHASGGPIVHYDFTRPASLWGRVMTTLGAAPEAQTPNDPRNQYAIDAYLRVGLDPAQPDGHPDVTLIWLNDPDGTAHANGIGVDVTRRSLALADTGIGRIEDALRAMGRLGRTNIIVTSDHGFSTHVGGFRLEEAVQPFARPMADGSVDIAVAEGAIYLRSGTDPARTAAIVAALQKRPEIGAIFTRSAQRGDTHGAVPGTLSFDVARWGHARSGDILVSANWTSDANAAGYRGTTTQGGVAGHGTSSVWDIHNTLIAAGPAFLEHATSQVPTGAVDLAPTLLHLLGLPAAPTMSGRVMHEGLRSGSARPPVRVERQDVTVKSADGSYEVTARLSVVDGYRYLDFTEVRRR